MYLLLLGLDAQDVAQFGPSQLPVLLLCLLPLLLLSKPPHQEAALARNDGHVGRWVLEGGTGKGGERDREGGREGKS